VHASDNDIDLNGAVSYAFALQTTVAHGNQFGIDVSTGEIFVKGSIDYEQTPKYRLVVVAQDRGLDSVPASVHVHIQVIDINDNAPEISMNTLSSVPGTADITEDSAVGTFVADVTVTDRDAGSNGRLESTVHQQLLDCFR